ncbi:phosphotransferase [Streptomyces sp. NPDC056937]|uniref:phosphotransferase n=1 Tax=Streptomyces sp. NPDC056937 TaxID=3345969 RepID=UPI0036272ACD
MHSWTPAVHELIRHLKDAGFPYSKDIGFPYPPRVRGIDEERREALTCLDGESGPQGWAKVVDDAGLVSLARFLRGYHDAVAGFRLHEGLSRCTGESGPGGGEVSCHGDFGPWSIVWQRQDPLGIPDWDCARPADRLHDVAALEFVAPFRDDAECLRRLRYPEPPDRRHRLELFADAYGLTSADGLSGVVIDVQQTATEQVRGLAGRNLQRKSAGQRLPRRPRPTSRLEPSQPPSFRVSGSICWRSLKKAHL